MNTWRKLFCLCALFVFAACGEPAEVAGDTDVPVLPAEELSDAEVLLTAATEAVLGIDAVSYTAILEGFFVEVDTTTISLTGEVVLKKGAIVDEACVYADYTLILPDETVSGTVASDGTTAYFIDHASEMFSSGSVVDGASRLIQNAPQGVLMVEYLIPDGPYGAELNAGIYDVLPQETIDGYLCDVVEVQMAPYISTWWLDAESHFPRANRISVWGPDGSGMEYTVILSELDVDIQPETAQFQLECPVGYSSEDYIGSVSVGSTAPLWTLETPDGGSISLEDLRGKVVVMDFWATWCGPCQMVMPALQEIHETFGEDLVIIGVNTWESEDPAAFMAENGYTYPIVINGDDVALDYFVEGIPTFYVIAPDGTVAYHAVGADPANEAALREILGTLLSE